MLKDDSSNLKNKMMMIWNNDNDRLSCSPILKRHKNEKTTYIREERTTTICDLPEEALAEVLIRLSVKDVVACVGVQKSWRSLIKTSMFLTLHSNYHKKTSSSSNPPKYLLFWDMLTDSYEIRVDDIQCEKYLTFKFPAQPPRFCLFSCRLVSNGLICIFQSTCNTDDDIYLWNPIIGTYKTLPKSPHPPYICKRTRWKAIAFGFLPHINDYVVVYMVKYGLIHNPATQYIITCVYSLNTNSWRKISHANVPDDVHDVSPHDSFIINGVAVWGALNSKGKRVIMCFDTKTYVLREHLLPVCVGTIRRFPNIYPFGQSIVYAVTGKIHNKNRLVMWVSKGDMMNEFQWEMKEMVRFRKNARKNAPLHVLGLRNNCDPIICNSHGLISYNLDRREFYDFFKSWDHDACVSPFVVKPFVESLILIDLP